MIVRTNEGHIVARSVDLTAGSDHPDIRRSVEEPAQGPGWAVAVYVRISNDPTGYRAGVQRQEQDCRQLCERRGWTVFRVYSDNDTSAWQGKNRPAYREMLADITAGKVQAVVAWHLDRLTRHPRELEELFDVCYRVGLRDMATVTGDIDLGTADGQLHARILGAVARKESDDKSRRIRRKMEDLAREGKVGGGGTRPFGYEPDRVTVRVEEAQLIQEAASHMVSGETAYSILVDWKRRGITTPTGRTWRTGPFKRMLSSPRIAGLRQHQGSTIGEAVWDAIIDEATHHRVVAILDNTRRRQRRAPRRYLLTGGLAICGLCGAKLVARPKGDGRRCYVCAKGVDFDGCGKIRQLAEPLERFVSNAIFTALDTPAFMTAITAQTDNAPEAALVVSIRQEEESLEELARDFYADKLITRGEYLAAREVLEERLDHYRNQLKRIDRSRTMMDLSSGRQALEEAWQEADLPWRQAVVETLIEKVIVHSALKGRNFFDPGRVELRWKA